MLEHVTYENQIEVFLRKFLERKITYDLNANIRRRETYTRWIPVRAHFFLGDHGIEEVTKSTADIEHGGVGGNEFLKIISNQNVPNIANS